MLSSMKRLLPIAFLLCWSCCLGLAQQPAAKPASVAPMSGVQAVFPDTPAGHQLQAWLAAFNRGDAGSYRQFIEKNFPSRLQQIDQDIGSGGFNLRDMTGGFDLRKVEESSPTRLVALVQERGSDQFQRLTLEVEAPQPNHITQLQTMPVPRPDEFALPHLGEHELIAALGQKVDAASVADRFSGAVLLAKDGKAVFEQAYGLADRDKKLPNTLNTRFRIGSMSKMFTAVATLQLVQAGKLGLDDPLGKYLTDYPNKDVASKVTIRHLLTHTGGTGDIFTPESAQHRLDLRTLQDYVNLFGKRGLEFEPGSRSEYSNYGFLLLGALIERVSGETYYDYVRDHVYKPAGMTASGSEPEEQAVANRSVGYMKQDGTWRDNSETLPYRGTSAGGGYSTVADLLAFANALQQHKLLNAQYFEMLTTAKVDTPNGPRTLGLGESTINGIRCFGHAGGFPGMNGDLRVCPATGYTIAVLANVDPPAAQRISDFIRNRLPKE